jgi:hypothetical protein
MAEYRKSLPQLGGELFLADGGIETTLIFLEGLELPDRRLPPAQTQGGRGRGMSAAFPESDVT